MIALEPTVVEFLSAGTRTGKLGWTAADGRPLVAPVWFIVEDGGIVFNTSGTSRKAAALRRDPRAVLCVDLEAPPYGFVQVQGVVELSAEPVDLLRVATAIGARYMGPDLAEEFGRRNGVPGELLGRLVPRRVIADFDMTG